MQILDTQTPAPSPLLQRMKRRGCARSLRVTAYVGEVNEERIQLHFGLETDAFVELPRSAILACVADLADPERSLLSRCLRQNCSLGTINDLRTIIRYLRFEVLYEGCNVNPYMEVLDREITAAEEENGCETAPRPGSESSRSQRSPV